MLPRLASHHDIITIDVLPTLELLLVLLLVFVLVLLLLFCVLLLVLLECTTLLTLKPPGEAAPFTCGDTAKGAAGAIHPLTIADGGAAASPPCAATSAGSARCEESVAAAGAPCRRTSTATLSTNRSHAVPSRSTAEVSS